MSCMKEKKRKKKKKRLKTRTRTSAGRDCIIVLVLCFLIFLDGANEGPTVDHSFELTYCCLRRYRKFITENVRSDKTIYS